MNFGGAVRQPVRAHVLARVGSRLGRQALFRSRNFARYSACGIFAVLNGNQRRPGNPIEDVNESLLAGLDYRVHVSCLALNGYQCGRRREVAVPEIVLHTLEVPDSFAGRGMQSDETVSEQIVPESITAIEIERRRPSGYVDYASLAVERHTRPVISGSTYFPGVFGPCVVTQLTGTRNGVK